MIKYVPLDDEEEDVPPVRSPVRKKARSWISMYDQMLDDDDEENNVPLAEGIVMTFLVQECYGSPKKQEF